MKAANTLILSQIVLVLLAMAEFCPALQQSGQSQSNQYANPCPECQALYDDWQSDIAWANASRDPLDWNGILSRDHREYKACLKKHCPDKDPDRPAQNRTSPESKKPEGLTPEDEKRIREALNPDQPARSANPGQGNAPTTIGNKPDGSTTITYKDGSTALVILGGRDDSPAIEDLNLDQMQNSKTTSTCPGGPGHCTECPPGEVCESPKKTTGTCPEGSGYCTPCRAGQSCESPQSGQSSSSVTPMQSSPLAPGIPSAFIRVTNDTGFDFSRPGATSATEWANAQLLLVRAASAGSAGASDSKVEWRTRYIVGFEPCVSNIVSAPKAANTQALPDCSCLLYAVPSGYHAADITGSQDPVSNTDVYESSPPLFPDDLYGSSPPCSSQQLKVVDDILQLSLKSLKAESPSVLQPTTANAPITLPFKLDPSAWAYAIDMKGSCYGGQPQGGSFKLDLCSSLERRGLVRGLAELDQLMSLPATVPMGQTASISSGNDGKVSIALNDTELPKFLLDALLQAQEVKRIGQGRQQSPPTSSAQPATTASIVGVVTPTHREKDTPFSGSITTDPKQYQGVPGLQVQEVTLPLVIGSDGKPTLQGLVVDTGNGILQLQPGTTATIFLQNGKLTMQPGLPPGGNNSTGAAKAPGGLEEQRAAAAGTLASSSNTLVLQPSGNPPVSLTLNSPQDWGMPSPYDQPLQPIAQQDAFTYTPASGAHDLLGHIIFTPPICLASSVTAVHGTGQFSGNANKLHVSFGGEPVTPIAATTDGFFFQVPSTAGEGSVQLVFADQGPHGWFAASATIGVLHLQTGIANPNLHKGMHTTGTVNLTGSYTGFKAPATPQPLQTKLFFDPDLVSLTNLQKQVPDFQPPKPGQPGFILLSILNRSPGIISIDGFTGNTRSWYLPAESLPFNTELGIKAIADGGFDIGIIAQPLFPSELLQVYRLQSEAVDKLGCPCQDNGCEHLGPC